MFAVFAAAIFHATWNALLKSSGDRLVSLAMQDLTLCVIGVVLLTFFIPFPNPASWIFAFGSAVVHIVYRFALYQGYKTGDLSRVYPIARGSAPLLVALAGFVIGDDIVSAFGVVGVVLVSIGIMLLVLAAPKSDHAKFDNALWFALLAGLSIAAYSVIDSRGVRLTETALDYLALLYVMEGSVSPTYLLVTRGKSAIEGLKLAGRRGIICGLCSASAYSLVIWAYKHISPSQVVALRESSVIIGAAIGAYILKEGFGPRRILSATVVVAGVVLLTVYA